LTLNNLSPYGIGISFSIFIGVGLVKQLYIILDVITLFKDQIGGMGGAILKQTSYLMLVAFGLGGITLK